MSINQIVTIAAGYLGLQVLSKAVRGNLPSLYYKNILALLFITNLGALNLAVRLVKNEVAKNRLQLDITSLCFAIACAAALKIKKSHALNKQSAGACCA